MAILLGLTRLVSMGCVKCVVKAHDAFLSNQITILLMNNFTKMILTMTAPVDRGERGVAAVDLFEHRCWDLVTEIHGQLPKGKFMEWPRDVFWAIEMRCYRTDPDLMTRDWRLFRRTVQRVMRTCYARRCSDTLFWAEVEVAFYRIYIHRLSALFLSENWQKHHFFMFGESICQLQQALDQLCSFILKPMVTDQEWIIYRSSIRIRTTQCMAELIGYYDKLVRGQITPLSPQFKAHRSAIDEFRRFVNARLVLDKSESVLFDQYIESEEAFYEACYHRGMLLARELDVSTGQLTLAGQCIRHYRDRVLALYQQAILCVS